jgi:hypothetical protein
MFKVNEGTTDRVIRLILGLFLVIVGTFLLKGLISTLLIVLGIILFITAITGFCGLYALLGINTKK